MYIYHYLGSDQDMECNGGVVFPFRRARPAGRPPAPPPPGPGPRGGRRGGPRGGPPAPLARPRVLHATRTDPMNAMHKRGIVNV